MNKDDHFHVHGDNNNNHQRCTSKVNKDSLNLELWINVLVNTVWAESAAITLGQDRDFLNCLVDWCAVEEHAGVKGQILCKPVMIPNLPIP